ncbi:MAG: hypothetical protein Q8K60_03900 [Parachlamydiaceae bacterium]|nr:hypothetical protein [Parachlamydiaceae bacterium]
MTTIEFYSRANVAIPVETDQIFNVKKHPYNTILEAYSNNLKFSQSRINSSYILINTLFLTYIIIKKETQKDIEEIPSKFENKSHINF